MGLFDFITKRNQEENKADTQDNFQKIFGLVSDYVTPEDALGIPVVNACLSKIADVVASADIKLLKKTEKGIEIIKKDPRIKLLNSKMDKGRLSSFEFKKLIVRDYFLKGESYFYIDRKGNFIRDIKYLDQVSVFYNNDPLNKVFTFQVNNKKLKDYELLKFARNSKNGVKGKAIIQESGLHFKIILKTMERMLIDLNRGFMPKGFFTVEKNINPMALQKLKETMSRIIADNEAGYMFFNQGVNFESLEGKKDAQKEANALTNEINKIASIFGVPVSIISGGANEEDKFNFINFTILPLLSSIEASLNRDLLLESEQGTYFFAFETKELLKGNIYERYKAYEVGIKNNILSMDEVRELENMPPLDFGFYKMNIADAFYYKDKDLLVNVNSGVAIKLSDVEPTTKVNGLNNPISDKGGDRNEDEHKSMPK